MPGGGGYGNRLYLGRLPSRCREDDIERFFKNYGRVRDIVMKNGFAFVEMEDARDADDACYELNGRDLMGERVTVEPCRRIRERRTGRPAFLDKYGPPVQTRHKLLVTNLSTRVSWQDLKDLMRKTGDVTYADAHKGRMKNAGVVCFSNRRDMEDALEKYQGYDLNGRKIELKEDSRRSGSRSRSRSRSRGKRSRTRSRSPRSRSRSRSRSRKRSRSRTKSRSASRSRSRSESSRSRSRSRSRSKDRKSKKDSKRDKKDRKEKDTKEEKRSKSPKNKRKHSFIFFSFI